jgi:YD repeat-containing protein
LSYDAAGRLSVLTDPAGQRISYTYDSEGSLAGVGYPDQSERRYHYTSVNVGGRVEPALLAELTDENATSYATWTYDGNALVSSSEHAGGVEHYALTYQKDSHDRISGATLIHPLGAVSQYAFEDLLGANRIRSLSHPLLPGVARTFAYDAHGNLTTQSDFNGNLTTRTWDLSRNLETRRSEALGRPEERTVTTQWHPLWRLPVRIAEPGRIRSWIYHGDTVDGHVVHCAPDAVALPGQAELARGVVCRKTEQTSDDATGSSSLAAMATGPARIWIFTYDRFGQLLSTDGPRTDLADLTTYSYYDDDAEPGRRGHLASITNALGQVTRITADDAHGNPLTLIDPNGIAHDALLRPRQRLTSRSVDGETTTYDYDRVGQLIRITLPDGSRLHYTYDAAQRLISVADSLGNAHRIHPRRAGKPPSRRRARPRRAAHPDAPADLRSARPARPGHRRARSDHRLRLRRQRQPHAPQRPAGAPHALRLRRPRSPDPADRPRCGRDRYAYNGQDHLIKVTDPRKLATTYRVDGLGNRHTNKARTAV